MESAHGSVLYPPMLAGVLLATRAGAVWTLVAMISGTDRGDAFWNGALGGILLCTIWLIYSAVVVGILRLTGKTYSQIATEGRRKPQR